MKKILIAYDGSEASKKAIDVGLNCAQIDDAIILLTIILCLAAPSQRRI